MGLLEFSHCEFEPNPSFEGVISYFETAAKLADPYEAQSFDREKKIRIASLGTRVVTIGSFVYDVETNTLGYRLYPVDVAKSNRGLNLTPNMFLPLVTFGNEITQEQAEIVCSVLLLASRHHKTTNQEKAGFAGKGGGSWILTGKETESVFLSLLKGRLKIEGTTRSKVDKCLERLVADQTSFMYLYLPSNNRLSIVSTGNVPLAYTIAFPTLVGHSPVANPIIAFGDKHLHPVKNPSFTGEGQEYHQSFDDDTNTSISRGLMSMHVAFNKESVVNSWILYSGQYETGQKTEGWRQDTITSVLENYARKVQKLAKLGGGLVFSSLLSKGVVEAGVKSVIYGYSQALLFANRIMAL